MGFANGLEDAQRQEGSICPIPQANLMIRGIAIRFLEKPA